jgi:hypothetical protein
MTAEGVVFLLSTGIPCDGQRPVGLGVVYPHGPVFSLTGVKALTGLMMIGWSASFTWLCMARYRQDDEKV